MEPLLPVQVTPELRSAVAAMTGRLAAWGTPEPSIADGWSPFARALGLEEAGAAVSLAPGEPRVPVTVGPIGTTLDALEAAAATGAIGFVAPAALRRRWWQREPTVFLDPTIEVWQAGWTPLAVARIDVAGSDATIEVVVGNARPTPERPVSPR